MEALVPSNHILWHIDRVLDMSFVRQLVNPLYSADTGRPATAPELVVHMHAGYRWFCRLNFDAPVTDRTTLVKTRKRWAQAGVFDEIMKRSVEQCIKAGLVKGERLALAVGR